MKGYGKILRVNLGSGEIKKEDVDEKIARKFLGGLGFTAYYLYKEVPKGADPLGEENKIFIAPGLLTPYGIPTASKTAMTSKSPLTGALGRTVVGAPMGVELKKAGYEMLVIEGKSEKPVVIRIEDGDVSIEPADELWGMTTRGAQKLSLIHI